MKILWNKVTWYSKLAAVVLGIGILTIGIYVGVMYQRGLDAMEFAGELELQRPPIVQKKTITVYAFSQEGNIKNVATGEREMDGWVLVYEAPGAPALTKSLIFTTQSKCAFNGADTFCDTSRFEQGQRVKVMGAEDGSGTVTVERMEVL